MIRHQGARSMSADASNSPPGCSSRNLAGVLSGFHPFKPMLPRIRQRTAGRPVADLRSSPPSLSALPHISPRRQSWKLTAGPKQPRLPQWPEHHTEIEVGDSSNQQRLYYEGLLPSPMASAGMVSLGWGLRIGGPASYSSESRSESSSERACRSSASRCWNAGEVSRPDRTSVILRRT